MVSANGFRKFAAIFVICLLSTGALASSMCNQVFTVYGKTKGEHSILFWDVYIGGDCYHWYTHALFLGYEQPHIMMDGHDFGGKDWIPQILTDLPVEPSFTIGETEGLYRINQTAYFTPPEHDSTFMDKYSRLGNDGPADARHWYNECPVNCSDYPVFYGAESELIYSYDKGLYKNYGFSQVIYFPESKYLVLVTDQPATAVGGDNMHGLMVYKLHFQEDK
ncbi:MAG: hypothetical protein GY841_23980 [FCB group bacterium]|nr:hypothetical protein [FCB group bacterium]